MAACPVLPLVIVRLVGDAAIEKSGFVTWTLMVVLWLFVALVPATVT